MPHKDADKQDLRASCLRKLLEAGGQQPVVTLKGLELSSLRLCMSWPISSLPSSQSQRRRCDFFAAVGVRKVKLKEFWMNRNVGKASCEDAQKSWLI